MSHTPEPLDAEVEIQDLDPTPVQERPWIVGPGRIVPLDLLMLARAVVRRFCGRPPSRGMERNGRSR
jgi:hypothetical protein